MNKGLFLLLIVLMAFNGQSQIFDLPSVNEPLSNEYAPSVSFDGGSMIFESDRSGDWRLYEVKKQSGSSWSSPRYLNEINDFIPKGKFVGASFQSYDGKWMLFTTDAPGGEGDMDIWMAEKDGYFYSTPTPLPAPVNSAKYEGFPSLSPDGNTLYFLRKNLPGKMQEKTAFYLYASRKMKQGGWEEPQLVQGLDAFISIETPKVLPDGKTMTFSAKAYDSKGGFDIYKASLKEEFLISGVENLDSVNSVWDDYGFSSDFSGSRCFFARTIDFQDDVFYFESKIAEPDILTIRLKVNLVDENTKMPVSGTILIRDLSKQNVLLNDKKESSEFELFLVEKSNISISASSSGYLEKTTDLYLTMSDQLVEEVLKSNISVEEIHKQLILLKKEEELFAKALEQESYSKEMLLQEYALQKELSELKAKGFKGISTNERERIKKKMEKMKLDADRMHDEACQIRYDAGEVMYSIFIKEIDKYKDSGDQEVIRQARLALMASASFRGEAASYRKKQEKTSVRKNILNYDNLAYEAEKKAITQLMYAYKFYLLNLNFNQKEIAAAILLTPLKKDFKMVLNSIHFDFDRSTIKEESFSELDFLVNLMHENPELRVEISAHTDDKGSMEYNEKLSQQRANEVVKYMISRNIDQYRLSAVGFGSSKPLVPNDTEENRALNRRVEFRIID